ncbi:MAG TPA: hypothetical protein VIC56_02485 [Gemmatimonadota bacterium]|jgi:hypothetical protein
MSESAPSLLGQCQRLLENTYGQPAGVELADFIIGRDRFRDLRERAGEGTAGEFWDGARFFYYVTGGDLRMAIFYSDELIRRLEDLDPRRGLGDANVLEFVVFLEELSHALHTTLTFRTDRRRILRRSFPAELELHARIDVFLALVFFLLRLEGGRRLSPAAREWVLGNVFDRWSGSYRSPELARRYRVAERLGRRAIAYLDSLPRTRRLDEVRRLRVLSLREKSRLLGG